MVYIASTALYFWHLLNLLMTHSRHFLHKLEQSGKLAARKLLSGKSVYGLIITISACHKLCKCPNTLTEIAVCQPVLR